MLKAYRRHTPECEHGPAAQPERGLRAIVAKKFPSPKYSDRDRLHKLNTWNGCECQIWFRGTWAGRTYPRQTLGVNDWGRAEELLQEKMQNPATIGERIPLADAMTRWLRDKELAKRSDNTIKAAGQLAGELQETAGEGALLSDVDSDTIARLRFKWISRGLQDGSHRVYLSILSGFYKYAITERKWVQESPMPHAKEWPPKALGDDRAETMPIDPNGGDANYRAILAALNSHSGRRQQENGGRAPGALVGPRLAALVELMYYSGMRVSDAITFRPARLAMFPDVAQYTYLPIKTARLRRSCTTFVPLWLATKLAGLKPLTPGYPFWDGRDRDAVAQAVRRELRLIGDECGVAGVRPQRFRDSFAINSLTANPPVPLKMLSAMLGHKTVATTEEFYLPWVDAVNEHARAAYIASRPPAQTGDNVVEMPRKQA